MRSYLSLLFISSEFCQPYPERHRLSGPGRRRLLGMWRTRSAPERSIGRSWPEGVRPSGSVVSLTVKAILSGDVSFCQTTDTPTAAILAIFCSWWGARGLVLLQAKLGVTALFHGVRPSDNQILYKPRTVGQEVTWIQGKSGNNPQIFCIFFTIYVQIENNSKHKCYF